LIRKAIIEPGYRKIPFDKGGRRRKVEKPGPPSSPPLGDRKEGREISPRL